MRVSVLKDSPYFSTFASYFTITLNEQKVRMDVIEASEKEGWVDTLQRDAQGRLVIIERDRVRIIRKYGKVTIDLPERHRQQVIEQNPNTREK